MFGKWVILLSLKAAFPYVILNASKLTSLEGCVNIEVSHFEKGQSLVSLENFKEGNFPIDREEDIDCHGNELRRAEENAPSLSSGKKESRWSGWNLSFLIGYGRRESASLRPTSAIPFIVFVYLLQ